MRRVDPRQRSLKEFFQDEIAKPLHLEFYISLPAEIPDSRIANIIPVSAIKGLFNLGKQPYLKSLLNPLKSKSITYRTVMNLRSLTKHSNLNRRDFRSLEMPSVNGIGLVRSMAKAYAVFAGDGNELGLKRETITALTSPPTPPPSGLRDEVMLVDTSFSLGFERPFCGRKFGISDKAFGFAGASGCFAFADPDARVGYAYAPNRMDMYRPGDPREEALRGALYRCLERLPDVQRRQ